MTKNARVDTGRVIETYYLPDGLTLADCFHADIAEQFIPCDDDVEEGWTYKEGVFAAPVPPEPMPERLDLLHTVPVIRDHIVELERRVKMLEDRTTSSPRRNS